MKITDMNLICLEECFEYLKLNDLLSVASANKRLRKAAEFIFFRKYSQGRIDIEISKTYFPTDLDLEIESEISSNGDLKACLRVSLQILRCFGHLINNVSFILFGSSGGNDHLQAEQHIFDYLNEYCADSLLKINIISISDFPKDKWIMFKKPFTRAEQVKIVNCNLDVRQEGLSKIFPKLKTLEYSGRKKNYIIGLIDYYPYLEELSIDMRENTTSILQLNPQLKKLKLHGNKDYVCDENTFRNLIEPMQNLEELKLFGKVAQFSNKKLKLKNVKKFDIHYSKATKSKYPFLFEQVECFSIDMRFTGITIAPHVYDFIDQHPTIEKLNISSSSCKYANINILRIAKALPLLMEINVVTMISNSDLFSVNDVLCLLSSFKSLKKLRFSRVHHPSDTFYDEVQACMANSSLTNKWRMSTSHQMERNLCDLERIDH